MGAVHQLVYLVFNEGYSLEKRELKQAVRQSVFEWNLVRMSCGVCPA
jgi:hypothetical protein